MTIEKVEVRSLRLVVAVVGIIFGCFCACDDKSDPLILYGNIDIRQIQLAFHDTGRIQRMLVQEGDRVDSGQLIAELDPSRYEAAATQAEGQLAAQQHVLDRLLAGSRPEEIAEAKARVKAAEADVWEAELVYERTKNLADSHVESQQTLDTAEASLKSARAGLNVAQQVLALAIKGPRQEDIDAARAQVKADEAALALARKELSDTKLYAPAAGVVQDRILEPGDMVTPQTPVFTIALNDPIWARAYVSEPDLGKITPGMRAEITTDSFPGKIYKGWIGFISPTAEFTPKQVETTELRSKLVYRVRVYVCNPENELRLGMPATVSIPLNQPRVSDIPESPCAEE
jgi:HlyD family secretion protein